MTLCLGNANEASQHAHVVNTFHFEIAAAFAKVSPLFAPEAERSWAGAHWDPVFLYPIPGRDIQGAVWTVAHGPHTSVWIATRFDVAAGVMQYVSVIDQKMISCVDVKVQALARLRTQVEVTYSRTALDPEANADVRALGEDDRTSGAEWQHGIESTLGLLKK